MLSTTRVLRTLAIRSRPSGRLVARSQSSILHLAPRDRFGDNALLRESRRYMPPPRASGLAKMLACPISDDLRVARPSGLEACRSPVSASTLERAVRDQAALQRGDLDGRERRVGDVLVLVICPEEMRDVAHPLGEN